MPAGPRWFSWLQGRSAEQVYEALTDPDAPPRPERGIDADVHPGPAGADPGQAPSPPPGPPFAWLAERAPGGEQVDVMVYLTDGFGPAPATPPPWPVLWARAPRGTAPAP